MSVHDTEQVTVVGPGAMGLLLSAVFAKAGIPVRLVDYRPDRARRLSERGVTLIEKDGNSGTYEIPCSAGEEGSGSADYVFLSVKAYDTEKALGAAINSLSPRGVLVSLQNGLRHVDILRSHLPRDRVVFGTTGQGATRVGLGTVRHCGTGDTLLAAEKETEETVRRVASLLERAGVSAAVVDDLSFILWRKLLFNAAINPVTALLGIRNGLIPRMPGAWEVAVSCFREARDVGTAVVGPELCQVTEDDLRDLCEKTAENLSSMLQDVRNGKRTEIEALNGIVVEEGRRMGKATPVNRVVVELVTALEEARR